jgi:hypothetical protein
MTPLRRRSLLLAAVLLLQTRDGQAQPDTTWPHFRHDVGRTGRTSGTGAITEPVPKWRYYLGGSTSPESVFTGDLDGDGYVDLLLNIGGKLVAQTNATHFLWDTAPMEISAIIGVEDLNGDGVKEVVAIKGSRPANAFVFDGRDGTLRWEEGAVVPDGAYGFTNRTVRLLDLDRDGFSELVLFPTTAGGYAFRFRGATVGPSGRFSGVTWPWDTDGDPSNGYATLLPARNYNNPFLGNFDDNPLDLELAYGTDRLTITKVADLTTAATYDVLGNMNFGTRQAVDLDGDGTHEIVLVDTDSAYRPVGVGVFDTRNRRLAWQLRFTDNPFVRAFPNSTVDLDADGTYEIVVSIYNDVDTETRILAGVTQAAADHDGVNRPLAWTTIVFDALTGTVEATLPNRVALGAEDLDGDGRFELVVQEVTNVEVPALATIHVHNFDGGTLTQNPSFSLSGVTVPLAQVTPGPDYSDQNNRMRLLARDLDINGRNELLLVKDGELRAYDVFMSGAATSAWVIPPTSSSISLLGVAHRVTSVESINQVLVARLDGYLDVLYRNLTLAAHVETGSKPPTPLVANLDGTPGANQMVLQRSNGAMEVVGADLGVTWTHRWPQDARKAVVLADLDGDGVTEIVTSEGLADQKARVVAFSPGGVTRWERVMEGRPVGAPSLQGVGDFDGDGKADLYAVYGSYYAPTCSFMALSGLDGRVLWERPDPPAERCTYNYEAAPSFHDADGNGVTDILFTFGSLYLVDGADGTTRWSAPLGGYGGLVCVADYGTGSVVAMARNVDLGATLHRLDNGQALYGLQGEFTRGFFGAVVDVDAAADGVDFVNVTSEGVLTVYDGVTGRIVHGLSLKAGTALPAVLDGFEVADAWTVSGAATVTAVTTAVERASALELQLSGAGTVGRDVAWDLSPFDTLKLFVNAAGLDVGVTLTLTDGAGLSASYTVRTSADSWAFLGVPLDAPDGGGAVPNLAEVARVEVTVSPTSGSGAVRLDALMAKRAAPGLTVPSVGDVDGDGVDEIVVGSSDGFLYALDARTGLADWVLNLYNNVGEPVLADVDGDGDIEVLVPLGDGYLYAVDQRALPDPLPREVSVDDNNQLVNPEADVDVSERTDVVGIAWDTVPGATGYRYALVNDNGTFVVSSTDAGAATRVVLRNLTLVLGTRYTALVQAYEEGGGTSGWGEGDGVLVADLTPPVVSNILAAPRAFEPVGGGHTTVTADVADPTGVTGYAFEVRALGDAPVLYQRIVSFAPQRRYSVVESWNGLDQSNAMPPDGLYQVTVRATDLGGHDGTAVTTVHLDITAPAAPVITHPTEGLVVNTPKPLVRGTAEPSATVQVSIDDNGVCSAATAADGAFSCASNLSFGDGPHVAKARVLDGAGHLGDPASVPFSIDTRPPAPPVITSPLHGAVVDTPRFLVQGSGEGLSSIVVTFTGPTPASCAAGANGEGEWECLVAADLSNGSYDVTATAADPVGNVSQPSAPAIRVTVRVVPDGGFPEDASVPPRDGGIPGGDAGRHDGGGGPDGSARRDGGGYRDASPRRDAAGPVAPDASATPDAGHVVAADGGPVDDPPVGDGGCACNASSRVDAGWILVAWGLLATWRGKRKKR